MKAPLPVAELLHRVTWTPTGCWEWTGARDTGLSRRCVICRAETVRKYKEKIRGAH